MNFVEFGDCREIMRSWKAEGIKAQMCVTSPPYFGLRDYGHEGQIGLEQTPEEYIAAMVEVFRCVRDVLADDGTLWLNIGDSYNNAGSSRNGEGLDGSRRGGATGPDGAAGYKKRDLRYALREHGIKHKDLIGIPWMLAFALRADGWYLRQDIIWHKPNPMPESVRDRCTKAHEYIFLLSKSERYFFDSDAMREPVAPSQVGRIRADPVGGRSHKERGQHSKGGIYATGNRRHDTGPESKASSTDSDNSRGLVDREARGGVQALEAGFDGGMASTVEGRETRNRRSVWTVNTKPYKGAHFATFPPALIEPCVLAGSRPGDIVLDPFMGSGTTAAVAKQHGRQYVGCELNEDYWPLQEERIRAIA